MHNSNNNNNNNNKQIALQPSWVWQDTRSEAAVVTAHLKVHLHVWV